LRRPSKIRTYAGPMSSTGFPVARSSPASSTASKTSPRSSPDCVNESGATIELTPVALLADDDNLIARARVTAERAGKRLDTENCYAFRFVDGKVADGQVFVSEPDRVDDFWK